MNRILVSLIILLSIALLCCDSDFTPKGEFRDKPVVYAILDPSQSVQFIRISRSYDPPGFNPLAYTAGKTPDIDSVIVSNRLFKYVFIDTLIQKADSKQYLLFYSTELQPEAGQEYSLRITRHDGGEINSNIIIPAEPGLDMNGARTYFRTNEQNTLIISAANAMNYPPTPGGALIRMWMQWVDSLSAGLKDTVRTEVPLYYETLTGGLVPIFPELNRDLSVVFPYNAFAETVRVIRRKTRALFLNVISKAYCLDRNAYGYIQIAHGFNDPLSFRTDLPDFSNIIYGYGVFGGITTDSLSIFIPRTILKDIQ